MKTLADLKRDAKSGTLEGRFTFHLCGKMDCRKGCKDGEDW